MQNLHKAIVETLKRELDKEQDWQGSLHLDRIATALVITFAKEMREKKVPEGEKKP